MLDLGYGLENSCVPDDQRERGLTPRRCSGSAGAFRGDLGLAAEAP